MSFVSTVSTIIDRFERKICICHNPVIMKHIGLEFFGACPELFLHQIFTKSNCNSQFGDFNEISKN